MCIEIELMCIEIKLACIEIELMCVKSRLNSCVRRNRDSSVCVCVLEIS